jgi:hypothetical protein
LTKEIKESGGRRKKKKAAQLWTVEILMISFMRLHEGAIDLAEKWF